MNRSNILYLSLTLFYLKWFTSIYNAERIEENNKKGLDKFLKMR